MTAPPRTRAAEAKIRDLAMSFPEATEDFPWGERAIKVKKKVFLFMYASDKGLSVSVKLPRSLHVALTLPFCQPTGYGLGKSGWVTAKFPPASAVPVELVADWLAESYEAVAPRKLAALASSGGVGSIAKPKKPATKRKPAKAKRR